MIGDTMVVKTGVTGTASMEDGEDAIALYGRGDNFEELALLLKATTLKVMLKLLEEKKK